MRPMLEIERDLCQMCRRCQARAVCRTKAIVQIDAEELPIIEMRRCLGCLACMAACPHRAVVLIDSPLRSAADSVHLP